MGSRRIASRSRYLVEHDLFRKPVPTFRDHALRAQSGALRKKEHMVNRDEESCLSVPSGKLQTWTRRIDRAASLRAAFARPAKEGRTYVAREQFVPFHARTQRFACIVTHGAPARPSPPFTSCRRAHCAARTSGRDSPTSLLSSSNLRPWPGITCARLLRWREPG